MEGTLRLTKRLSIERRASTVTMPNLPSPTDRNKACMKLASSNKVVEIRQTIYEDPGNPFTEESVPAMPSPPKARSGYDERAILAWDDSNWSRARTQSESAMIRTARDEAGGPKDSFGVAKSPAVLWQQESRPKLGRSLSVFEMGQDSNSEEYVSPRASWRKGSIAEMQLSEAQARKVEATDRNTEFYQFYDEVLNTPKERQAFDGELRCRQKAIVERLKQRGLTKET